MRTLKKAMSVTLIVACLGLLVGCSTHIHQVGAGAQGNQIEQARQWYVLWGLVPLNEVNSDQMAGMSTDYTIKTEANAFDVLINMVTTFATITSRTVTITR